MKKRIVQSLLLLGMMVSLSVPNVAPIMGQDDINRTDITLKEESTKLLEKVSPYAGVTETIGFETECVIEDYNTFLQVGHCYYYHGWTTSNLNIRNYPSIDSEIIDVIGFNTEVEYSLWDDEWVRINYKGEDAFINRNYMSDSPYKYNAYPVPNNKGFKSYMPHTAITDTSSKQYTLQKNYAYTGNYGIRQVNGRYCVAIGTAFNSEIGDYVDLVLENGEVIPCIIADIKANKHTESNNIVTSSNGCVSEFVIDINTLDKNIKKHGDVSAAKEEWDSEVVVIKVYEKNVFN